MERAFWRSGAVVVSADGRVGFLISDQKTITVDAQGKVYAAGWDDFLPVQIFGRDGMPVSFSHSLLVPVVLEQTYPSCFALLATVLVEPGLEDMPSLVAVMASRHDARAYRLQDEVLFAHREQALDDAVSA